MARGRGKGSKGKPGTNLLAKYGMPSGQTIRHQALNYAQATAPSKGGINRQYGRAKSDVQNFTLALADLLKGDSASNGYQSAIADTKRVNAAAASRLQQLDPALGNLAASSGDTGLRGLESRGAAAQNYLAQQPGVAAGRGQMQNLALTEAQQEALRQRADAIRQTAAQVLPQFQQNAMALAQANAGIYQNNRQFTEAQRQFNAQFSEGRRQFNANLNWSQQQAAVQAAQFNQQQGQQWKEFLLEQARLTRSMTTGPGARFTPSQIQKFQSDSFDAGQSAIRHGVPVQKFISDGIGHGIPKSVMVATASRIYGGIPSTRFSDSAVKQRAHSAWQSYVQWMQGQQWAKYKKHSPKAPKNQRNPHPPGHATPGPKGPRNQRNDFPPGARG